MTFTLPRTALKAFLKNLNSGEKILIIDNNSPDESYKKLRNYFKDFKVLKSKENKGYAGGHQITADYAINHGFNFIWILNNDLKVRKDTLKNLIKSYKNNGLGIYGSITLKSENPDIINFGGEIQLIFLNHLIIIVMKILD